MTMATVTQIANIGAPCIVKLVVEITAVNAKINPRAIRIGLIECALRDELFDFYTRKKGVEITVSINYPALCQSL